MDSIISNGDGLLNKSYIILGFCFTVAILFTQSYIECNKENQVSYIQKHYSMCFAVAAFLFLFIKIMPIKLRYSGTNPKQLLDSENSKNAKQFRGYLIDHLKSTYCSIQEATIYNDRIIKSINDSYVMIFIFIMILIALIFIKWYYWFFLKGPLFLLWS